MRLRLFGLMETGWKTSKRASGRNGHFVRVNYYVHSPTTVWYGGGDDGPQDVHRWRQEYRRRQGGDSQLSGR